MKKPQTRIKAFLFTAFFLTTIFSFANHSEIKSDSVKSTIISFKIKLKSNEKITIKPSSLKFNKHFAYSFTLDDGYRSAYLTAFPLLNGGKISASNNNEWKIDQGGDGTNSSGLFYSDGLGNKIPFKLGLAINGASLNNSPKRGHLSWAETKEMYNAGWDILNHGFHHATKHGTNYLTEVTENTTSIKQNLGFTISHFVVPGGDGDEKYYLEYEKDALDKGHFSVASYYGKGPVYKVNSKMDLDKLISARTFVQSSKDTTSFKTMDKFLKTIDSIVKQPDPVWFNEFTHGTGNTNLWNLSMRFPDFKYYMTTIANKYGVKGSDSVWMAPWQEVYEYLWLRDRIKVSYEQINNNVTVKIELPKIPENFRHRAISLKVETPSKFETESNSSELKISSDGKTKHSLINIQLK
ncbi:polysaccharide deacetylase [Flavobacterium sp. 270]|uniref:polysaccharide deacetylase family protein n=1 Tax=Flavobacterium sp. 270 TaxID=2512114 RepID=UPI001065EA93|nr:polysaccharide deacetylase family protein [Flavobacterium sp. 270]TDW44355.1 polysaccharide deacetylase [Flavobacterium sp. 270]